MAIISAGNKGKIKSNSTNVRENAGTGYNRIYYANAGDIVTVVTGKTGTDGNWWMQVTNDTQSSQKAGWIREDTVDAYSGGSSGGTGTVQTGTIQGTNVNVRASASTSATIKAVVNTGVVVSGDPTETYTGSGYTWYRCTSTAWSGDGYIASNYVNFSGGTSGGTTITYDNSAAITYAKNHSDNVTGVACPSRNTTFGAYTSNGCATFVSQCLCAGGLPMFYGWSYPLANIPSAWNANDVSKWNLTYSGYTQLNNKGRLTAVAYNAVQAGDIIYTYDSTQPAGYQYTHVTIAIAGYAYDSSTGKYGCRVCGHTVNQYDKFKELTASNCKCYRVKSTVTVGSDEKRVLLPATGNGATVL